MKKGSLKHRFQELEVPVQNTNLKSDLFAKLDSSQSTSGIAKWLKGFSIILTSSIIMLVGYLSLTSDQTGAESQLSISTSQDLEPNTILTTNTKTEKTLNQLATSEHDNQAEQTSEIPNHSDTRINTEANSGTQNSNAARHNYNQESRTIVGKENNTTENISELNRQKQASPQSYDEAKNVFTNSVTSKEIINQVNENDVILDGVSSNLQSPEAYAVPLSGSRSAMKPIDSAPIHNVSFLSLDERVITLSKLKTTMDSMSSDLEALSIDLSPKYALGITFGYKPREGFYLDNRYDELGGELFLSNLLDQYSVGLLFQQPLFKQLRLEHKFIFAIGLSEDYYAIRETTTNTAMGSRYQNNDLAFVYKLKALKKLQIGNQVGIDIGIGPIVNYDHKDMTYNLDTEWTEEPSTLKMGLEGSVRCQVDINRSLSFITGYFFTALPTADYKLYHDRLSGGGLEFNVIKQF